MRAHFKTVPLRRELLRGLACFRHLDGEALDALCEQLEGRIYEERREILSQTYDDKDVFFLINGRVQATNFSRSGRVVTFDELRSGAMFGELAAIDDGPRTANIVTLSECLVVKMSPAVWWALVRSDAQFAESAFRRLSAMARYLCERITELHVLSVPDRIRVELYRLAMREQPVSNEVKIAPSPTQAELASRIGTNREAVTREIAVLAREGLVRQSRRSLTITDLEAFEQSVQGLLNGTSRGGTHDELASQP